MNGPYYIVSDNHFSMNNDSKEHDRREKIFKVFDKIKMKGKGSLIIGGDFFDYWFDYKNQIPSGYDSILNALKDLHNNNIKIHYIAGNHDFWDFGYLNNYTGLEFYKGDLELNSSNKKILLTHGDGILKSDVGYRFMRKIIRSKLFIFLYNLLPPSLTCSLSKKISKSSSDYNHHDKYKDMIFSDTMEYAEEKWKAGYDIVCIGHYHQTGIIKKGDKVIIYLGDWLSKYTVTYIDDGKTWQGNWQEFLNLS